MTFGKSKGHSNVTQMASWVKDRLSLGSSRNLNVVNSREVSSQIDVSNWKILNKR